MAKLEIAILAGEETKSALEKLTKLVERLEAAVTKVPCEPECLPEEMPEEEEDFAAPKAKKKAVKSESFDEGEEVEVEIEEEPPVTPPKKQKKLTVDDCNDAAKALAKLKGRDAVLSLMQKHFKTKSVSDLKPERYAEFCEKMAEALE